MFLDIAKVLARIKETDKVMDLGGWHKVFPRANVVVDLQPYETRNIVYPHTPESFGKNDWLLADFCSHSFWETIPDKEFDFIIISHTLEDIRDPLYVCSQMIRCAKAGYIECPSKFRECAKQSAEDTWSGYNHHRWIIEPMKDETGLIFKAKLSWAHHKDYLGDARRNFLGLYQSHFNAYFWQGSFKYIEHFPKGTPLEQRDLEYFYSNFPYDQTPKHIFDLTPNSSDSSDGRCLWVNEYLLPSEMSG